MKIEKNVQMPSMYKSGKQVRLKWPLNEMEVGDSILIPAKTKKQKYETQRNVCTVVYNWKKWHGKDWRFTTKAEDKGVRVWRTK